MQPIDTQTNGPQLLYGLRYHTHITKPDQIKIHHEQVGYWLWEPATRTVIRTLTIPRAIAVMTEGQARADDKSFEVVANHFDENFGICATPFLDYAFKMSEFRIKVDVHDDGTWSCEEDSMLQIKDKGEPFHHTDRNFLIQLAPLMPNPLARALFARSSATASPFQN